jgi:hypothetical protein
MNNCGCNDQCPHRGSAFRLKEPYRTMVARVEAIQTQRQFMLECLMNEDSSYYTADNGLTIIQADLKYLLSLMAARRKEFNDRNQ